MPYTKEQRKLFNAAAHDPDIAEHHGMSGKDADKLADEANKLKKEDKEKRSSFIDLEPVFGRSQGR
jgi:hypothetical protein